MDCLFFHTHHTLITHSSHTHHANYYIYIYSLNIDNLYNITVNKMI